MPLPIIIGIAAAVAAAIVGGTIALNWNQIVLELKGKRLAVIGERQVGKTTLITYLKDGSVPAEYRETVVPEKAKGERIQLNTLQLDIKTTMDVPGTKDYYADWQKYYRESDYVLYLLRADRLLAGDAATQSRVLSDFHHIESWRKQHSSPPTLLLIGTHCDLDPNYASTSAGNYSDRFRKLPVVVEAITRGGGGAAVKVVLGSMETSGDAEALVFNFLKAVTP
jgi:hypothetical protein